MLTSISAIKNALNSTKDNKKIYLIATKKIITCK